MAYWGDNPVWQALDPTQKAAAMALLEADVKGGKPDVEAATNAMGAMINRAARDNVDLGQSVSGRIYQPTIEDAQFARLPRVLQSPEFQQLTALAQSRLAGATPDWVNGATHFLAPEKTMLSLEAQDPGKYRSWRQWTGYDADSGQYSNVVFRDNSHAFLAPEGRFSAQFGANTGAIASAAQPATSSPDMASLIQNLKAQAPSQSASAPTGAQTAAGPPAQAAPQAPAAQSAAAPPTTGDVIAQIVEQQRQQQRMADLMTPEASPIPQTGGTPGAPFDPTGVYTRVLARLRTGKLGV